MTVLRVATVDEDLLTERGATSARRCLPGGNRHSAPKAQYGLADIETNTLTD